MTITCGTFTSGSELHGSIKVTPWDFSRNVQSFFGLTGEFHLHGRLHGRDLSAWILPRGYATHALLHTAIESVNGAIGTTGTLTWSVGGDSKMFANCVFNGLDLDEDPWYDGSGVNGWQVLGQLRFRQIKQ